MTDDLIKRAEEAESRVAELEARLEITHYSVTDAVTGEVTRRELTEEERKTFPDGIACRDVTIEVLGGRVKELEASIRWVDEVYPARIEAGGAGIEITWDDFNAMQRALGVKVDARIGSQEGRAGHNHKLRVRAMEAEARAEKAEAALAAAPDVAQAVAEERERCAMVADPDGWEPECCRDTSLAIAAAIREGKDATTQP